MSLTDDDIMPFGKHNKKGTKMKDVPAKYLDWLLGEMESDVSKGKQLYENQKLVIDYIRQNIDAIHQELEN